MQLIQYFKKHWQSIMALVFLVFIISFMIRSMTQPDKIYNKNDADIFCESQGYRFGVVKEMLFGEYFYVECTKIVGFKRITEEFYLEKDNFTQIKEEYDVIKK